MKKMTWLEEIQKLNEEYAKFKEVCKIEFKKSFSWVFKIIEKIKKVKE